MARYTEAVCRMCRREGQKLFFKGERCFTGKCAFERRPNSTPGQHGQRRKKLSEYGMQHRAKQTARRYYGVLESQFENYFDMASRQKGVTGENLFRILETRLDNIVFRMGFAMCRNEARQMVTHGHVTVNGKRVNIPSYLVKVDDVIAVAQKSRSLDRFKDVIEANASRPHPGWLDVNLQTAEGKVIALPTREEIDLDVEEHLIVELYSK